MLRNHRSASPKTSRSAASPLPATKLPAKTHTPLRSPPPPALSILPPLRIGSVASADKHGSPPPLQISSRPGPSSATPHQRPHAPPHTTGRKNTSHASPRAAATAPATHASPHSIDRASRLHRFCVEGPFNLHDGTEYSLCQTREYFALSPTPRAAASAPIACAYRLRRWHAAKSAASPCLQGCPLP